MQRMIFLLLVLLVTGLAEPLLAQNKPSPTQTNDDPRQLVAMPEASRDLMRRDMIEHLSAIQDIIAALKDTNLDEVAEVAENRLGRSMMVRHRGRGNGPGRYMPHEMKLIGWSMHDAATAMANAAKQGDLSAVYKNFGDVTGACVACHNSYRTR